ncbi:tryptophan synthase subunit alpha [Desulfoluna sp.]|uniref:tryptophan synthase subunit alpha n=1 Tax=Desulfoluna sp. TaxID=2045199 RepID=UPI002626B497|nr:tryptophan synthase subunit alpha [Desulfoluna sp.]
MKRIETRFKDLKAKDEKALVGFITACDPDYTTSLALVKEMCDAGLDVLELGIPFSDPTADGPIIQRSSERALKAGATITRILGLVQEIREYTEIPIVLFSYTNPLLAFGYEAFSTQAADAGVDGLLVVDMPPEESAELNTALARKKLDLIRLVAPTTYEKRIRMIADASSGFLYLISMIGVTGSGGLDAAAVETHYTQVKALTEMPVCVGFGISTPDDVGAIARFADGVVIGSAFERLIETNLDKPDLPALIGDQTRAYKARTKPSATGLD